MKHPAPRKLGLFQHGLRAAPLALLLVAPASLAQAPDKAKPKAATPSAAPSATPSAPPPAAPPAPSEEAQKATAKEQARAHFDKAVVLQEEEAWAPALAEFRLSLSLFPTRAATKNAAVCLQKLERYDESLEMFQTLVREYKNLTAEDKALAERSITRLQGLVGSLEVVFAEPAASVVVDGKPRGETPLKEPIRVSAGSHVVRVYKDGYLPFETRVDVAGAQTARVEAKLAALSESGRLKVSEAGGKALDVVIDNVVVGETPWEGALAPGAHSVSLRGGETFGTQPATARIKVNEVTSLNLVAEELEAWIRVEPTPAGASVFLDAVEVGRGVWEGRVRTGAHRIEVSEDGFVAGRRELTLAQNGREIVNVELERDRSAARWARPAHPFIDLGVGLALAPVLGGELDERCGAGCTNRVAPGAVVMAHAGYALSSGFELGVVAGFVSIGGRRTEDGVALLDPVGSPPPQRGSTLDVRRMNAVALGVHGGYAFGERFPVTARAAGGLLLGAFTDDRTGQFLDSSGSDVATGIVTQSGQIIYAYVGPELRVGYRLNDRFTVSAGVLGYALIGISRPAWDREHLVPAGKDGVGTYPAETLLGDVVFMVAPSLGARYDF